MIRNMSHAGGIVVLLWIAHAAPAAPVPAQDAKAAVATFFINLEKGAGDTAPLLVPPAKDVIAELAKYLGIGTEKQQGHAVRLIGTVGRLSKDKEARALAAKQPLNYATSDGKPEVRQALERLLEFSKADFPPAAATDIEKLVRVRDPHSEALLLAGLLDVRGVIKDLKPLAKNEEGRSPFSNNAWSANLALARLGDAGAVKHCVEAIAAEADLSQRVRHFPELAYIRQEAATRELVRHLMSEERLPGVKPGDPGGKIAVNALHALAESIEGFPIMTDRHGEYTEEQITTARKWVREQKELELKW